ncbi:MAG: alpha/beta hydrolase [Pseudomonadota bacterium]
MKEEQTSAPANLTWLEVGAGDTSRRIAVIDEPGDPNRPGLFWLGGFKSSMLGEKATALATFAKDRDISSTRFDYSGHGLSEGSFEDGTISAWLEEAEAVFQQVTSGPQILIGSSMGGWIALLLARALGSERIHAIALIAPAWDMTERLMWARFPDELKTEILGTGYHDRPSAYGDGDYRITLGLIEDGRNHLIGGHPMELGCPIHILHGRDDPDVPLAHGLGLIDHLPHDEVLVTIVPDGDHRLSRPQDIALLLRILEALSGA